MSPEEKVQQSGIEKRTTCRKINKELAPYKSHYFLLNGAHVGVIPYLPVFAKATLGFSASTVGLLSTCMFFSTTLSKPLFGLIADCFRQMKFFIGCLLALEVVLNLSMLALPPIEMGAMSLPNRSGFAPLGKDEIIPKLEQSVVYNATVLYSKAESYLDSSGTGPHPSDHLKGFSDSYVLKEISSEDSFSEEQYKNYKCVLDCSSLIDHAVCFQRIRRCSEPSAPNLLMCGFRQKRHSNAFCHGFRRNYSFSNSIDTLNLVNELPEVASIPPETVVYNKRSFLRKKISVCNATYLSCRMRCDQHLTYCREDEQQRELTLYVTYQFWVFCLLAMLGAMCHGAMFTLSDTACYEKLRGTSSDYGRQRFWGAIGWGLAAPLVGTLNDVSSRQSGTEDFSPGWYVMAAMSAFCLLNLFFMDIPKISKSESVCRDVVSVLTSRRFMLMNMNIFFLGMLNAYASNYVLWYIQNLGGTKVQMGLALTVSCLFGEAPFMFISGWLISKLGHWNCVTFIFVAFGARFFSYFLITDPWMVLPVEVLHGITYGLCYAAMTSYSEFVSCEGTEATVQGVLGGTYQGLGTGIGCLVAGISFDVYGGRKSFLIAALFSICLAVFHHIMIMVLKPQKSDHKRQTKKNSDVQQV